MTNGMSGSRFTKYFRRGNNSGHNDSRRHDGPTNNQNNSFRSAALEVSKFSDRKHGSNRHAHETNEPNSFQNWLQLLSQNPNLCNNLLAQQQYLTQMLNKTQQSDSLKKMLHLNNKEGMPQGGPPARMPTQKELQFHTQSIMQNALLRKRILDQCKFSGEVPIPAVQQLIKSVHSNVQKVTQQGLPPGIAGQCPNFNSSMAYGMIFSSLL